MADGVIGPVAMLGDYLNRFIGERLVVTKLNAGMTAETLKPMREISSRYEKDTETLYISREHIKRDMDEHHFNFNELVESLVASGIVVAARALKTLGAGTMFTGGSVPCLKLRADHPELGLAL
jgi:hypothetical protein